ncbi:hypothetical protein K2173_013176 [Erythroxylum novogranatense]|uniref:S-protein homolog n=1 Tax=Erythroxylum novogranatense TaxID=1862640 RepID=A0AAV8TFD6_9ROSI|nr:hypothetical protein K2173_013176 [Erythroxylum novogranatense]
MSGSSNYKPLFFIILALAAVSERCVCGFSFFPKYHVHIINRLSSNILFVHCRSADDDLGDQNLFGGGDYSFSFRENIFKTTLFTCDFQTGDNHGGSYRVFWDDLTDDCGNDNCIWSARDDGLYFTSRVKNGEYRFYSWEW